MHESIEVGILPVLALAFVAWGLVSARLGRWNVSGPIAFVLLGFLLSSGSDPILELSVRSESILTVTELTLAVVLFGDAATVPLRRLEDDAVLPTRLLLVGLPLTIALGAVVAHLLLPGLSWWVCAVIGASVAPTDAALGAAIVEDERVPSRIRRLLNVESGLNDGIATPFVNFFLVAAVVGTSAQVESESAALAALALGAVLGIVVGAISGRALEAAVRAGWAEVAFVPIATLATALAGYVVAVGLGGNGFVAAFVAGIAYRAAHRIELEDEALELTHQMGTILSLGIWFVFGSIATGWLGGVSWREIAFALLALTAVRMAPVALALVRSGLDRSTIGVIGWFGPRGLASVVFALLAGDVLEPGDAQRTFFAIGTTVLLSVVLHGASAAPIAARYGSTHHQTEA